MAGTLEAGPGLHLHSDARGGLRVQWRERDWLGPLGVRIRRGGRSFAWGLPDVDSEPLTAAAKSFQGSDDLGQFHGWELIWQAAPLPLLTTVRGYVDLPLLVFRIEATGAVESLSTGEFAAPSVSWPAFVPSEPVR